MRAKAFLLGLAVALLWALPAFAQGNPTGKVSGRVMSDGQPVPGALVTATSPNLQGSKTTSTSSNAKSEAFGKPTGRAASVTRRFVFTRTATRHPSRTPSGSAG